MDNRKGDRRKLLGCYESADNLAQLGAIVEELRQASLRRDGRGLVSNSLLALLRQVTGETLEDFRLLREVLHLARQEEEEEARRGGSW
jgi:hypothetical protein